jgi:hypothetical protein
VRPGWREKRTFSTSCREQRTSLAEHAVDQDGQVRLAGGRDPKPVGGAEDGHRQFGGEPRRKDQRAFEAKRRRGDTY